MKIKVMIKEPYKAPYEAEIENTLEEFQRIVGGYIETVPLFEHSRYTLICNEEGKIKGLKPNVFWGEDVKCGTVIAVGSSGSSESFCDLPESSLNGVWLTLTVRAIHEPETIRRVTGYADGI